MLFSLQPCPSTFKNSSTTSYWPSGVVVSAAGVVTGPPSIKSRIYMNLHEFTWSSAAGLWVRYSCLHVWLHLSGNLLHAAKVPNGFKWCQPFPGSFMKKPYAILSRRVMEHT